MSIDVLQDKIRKMKNPSALVIAPLADQIPQSVSDAHESMAEAASAYCCGLLDGLRDVMPAVRVDPGAFAILGTGGLEAMHQVMTHAKKLGYYVILDWLRQETPAAAAASAMAILTDEIWPCDGVALNVYAGSDCVKPYASAAAKKKKSVFITLKTANKSGSELQDLQTGGRVVHQAAADLVNNWGESGIGRCGYSAVAASVGANNAGAIRTLRQKYTRMFLLVDGIDATGGNTKNASLAFDKVGHGAICCAGGSVLGAWKDAPEGTEPVAAAVEAAERMKRNISRYVTVL